MFNMARASRQQRQSEEFRRNYDYITGVTRVQTAVTRKQLAVNVAELHRAAFWHAFMLDPRRSQAVVAGDVVFDEIDALEELCMRYGLSQEAMSATLKTQAARAESADDPSQCTPLGLALLDGLLRFEP